MAGGEGCRDERRGSSASEVGTDDGTATKKNKKNRCHACPIQTDVHIHNQNMDTVDLHKIYMAVFFVICQC